MARRRLRAQAEGEVPGVTSLQPLASGGNSTVYRAWQPELDRWVAVKVLGVTLSDGRARERFLRECEHAVGRLTGHPNIVTVLASGVTRSNRPFLTMDLFERGSLAQLVATSGPVPVELALRHGVKLAGALETAHRAGILHRDLKPENVLLSRFGEPGLADFGIATLGEARGGTEAFTASHAAPEVLDGRPATAAADVYGLGSTLWTALAGHLPFGDGAEGPLKLMLRVLKEPLPPLGRPDVPPPFEDSLRWAMAKEPADRPESAMALGERLRFLQADLGLPVSELVVPDDLERLAAASPDPARAELHGASGFPPPTPQDRTTRIGPSGYAPPAVPPPAASGPATIRPGEGGWGRGAAPEPLTPWGDAAPPAPLDGFDRSPSPGDPGGLPAGTSGAPGSPPAPADRTATVVRPRSRPVATPDDEPVRSRSVSPWGVAIVAGSVLVALAIIAGAVIGTRGDTGTSPPTTTVPTVQAVPAPSSTAPGAPAPARRTATGVTAVVTNPTTVLVRWTPPADGAGLVGFVVIHRARLGGGGSGQKVVSDAKAVELTVVLATPEPQCFVVQSVYATGQGTASEPACT